MSVGSAAARRPPAPLAAALPVELRVLPGRTRRHLAALHQLAGYLAGYLDDDDRDPDAFEAGLRALYRGEPVTHPAVAAVAPTVYACHLPPEPLHRLAAVARAPARPRTFGEVCAYCADAVNPFGELALHVFGQANAERVALCDRICTALSVVESLYAVPADPRRARRFLPADDLDRFGVSGADLESGPAGTRVRELVAFQAERAAAWLEAGAPLVSTLTGWARLATGGYLARGRAALGALAAAGYDPWSTAAVGGSRVVRHWLTAAVRAPG